MSGEIKHGPLALIDDKMPVIMIIMKDNVYKVSLLLPAAFLSLFPPEVSQCV